MSEYKRLIELRLKKKKNTLVLKNKRKLFSKLHFNEVNEKNKKLLHK
jgi:hypothetical protein